MSTPKAPKVGRKASPRLSRRGPDVWQEGVQTLFCDFALALLKGVVEHGDGCTYFGSLLGYQSFKRTALERGHVVEVSEMRVIEGFRAEPVSCNVLKVTPKGAEAYKLERLDLLPQTAHRRAEWWDWHIPRVNTPIPSRTGFYA